MGKTLEIMDTTLRDGEQTSSVSFSSSEKLTLAKLLLQELKVDRIEIASARVSDGEFKAVKEITSWARKQNLIEVWESEFYYFSNVFFDKKEVLTTFNKDRSYTTIFKANWNAKGNFTSKTYTVYSFYEFKWKYDRINEIHVHWNNEPYYKEWDKLIKIKEYIL